MNGSYYRAPGRTFTHFFVVLPRIDDTVFFENNFISIYIICVLVIFFHPYVKWGGVAIIAMQISCIAGYVKRIRCFMQDIEDYCGVFKIVVRWFAGIRSFKSISHLGKSGSASR